MKIHLIFIFLILVSTSSAQEVPYRGIDNFEVFSSFQWIKGKPKQNPGYSAGPVKKYNATPVMHLSLTVQIKNVLPNEISVRATSSDDQILYRKKIKEGIELSFEFGDFEKVKKKEVSYLFTIFIVDKKKKILNKIKVEVLESGAIFVNDKPHGKN